MTRRTPAEYNWSKVEFDEQILPAKPARSSLRTETIQFVVVHHMTIVGKGTGSALDACRKVWATREASAHYGVDGKYVAQFVWDNRAAWATANRHGNHAGISIEHANSTAGPAWEVSEDTWRTGAKLVAHLHVAYKLGRPNPGKTLFQHSSFHATACAGPYLGKTIWGQYVLEAQRIYDEIVGAPAPAPAPETVKVRAMFTPFAGYNGKTKPGVLRWKKNTDGGAAIILKHKPDLVGTTEVAKKSYCNMLPRLTKALSGLLILVSGGSDGRYIYRNPNTTKYLFRKKVTTPDTKKLRLKHDDKQGFILGFEKDGIRGIFGVFHAENEQPFDEGRVNQALWFEDQVEALRKLWKVDPRNVLTVMDSNSESWVASKLKALKFKILKASSFVGWSRREDKNFDLSVTKGKGTAKEISSDGNSDHNFQVIDFELVK